MGRAARLGRPCWLLMVALAVVIPSAFVRPLAALPAGGDGSTRGDKADGYEIPELVAFDRSAPGLTSVKALEANSDQVSDHAFEVFTPEEVSLIGRIAMKLGFGMLKRMSTVASTAEGAWQDLRFNLETELEKAFRDEDSAVINPGVQSDASDDQQAGFPLQDKIAVDTASSSNRRKRSTLDEAEYDDVQSDIELHFPDGSPSTKPKSIKLPSGVTVNVEPGQSLTIGQDGEITTASSSSTADVKGHLFQAAAGDNNERAGGFLERSKVTITSNANAVSAAAAGDGGKAPKMDTKTLSTSIRPGYTGVGEKVPINPKVSGLVALLQKTVADGHFRRPMDKDLPIEQIQVKLRNGTRYFYEMTRDVTAVDHSLIGDCDPENDPNCLSSESNGRNAGNIHVHLSNGSTINYSFKKANQLDPISVDAKERALKIKLYVTAATALDDVLFRRPGSDEIMKDKVHFEEVFLEELGKKLRDASLLIPKDGEGSAIGDNPNPSGIIGNENAIPGGPTIGTGSGESLNTAVEHYMGLLNSEQTRNRGLVGSPAGSGPLISADKFDVGSVVGYALGGTCGVVVFLTVIFFSAHWIESGDRDAGRIATC